jgi:hypothetical protein
MIDFSDGSDNLKVGGQAGPDMNLWYARPPAVSNALPVARPSIGKMIGARTRPASVAAATPRDSSIDFSDLGGRFVPIFPAVGNVPAGEPLGWVHSGQSVRWQATRSTTRQTRCRVYAIRDSSKIGKRAARPFGDSGSAFITRRKSERIYLNQNGST